MTMFKSNGDRVPAVIESYAAEVKKGGMDRREFLAMASVMGASTALAYSMAGMEPAKAAAIRAYIPVWAKSKVWVYEHPDEWVQKYYVESQKLTPEQGRSIVELSSKPLFPASWDEALRWEQETIDLLAEGGFVKSFQADVLFDRRFEGLTAEAVPESYRS